LQRRVLVRWIPGSRFGGEGNLGALKRGCHFSDSCILAGLLAGGCGLCYRDRLDRTHTLPRIRSVPYPWRPCPYPDAPRSARKPPWASTLPLTPGFAPERLRAAYSALRRQVSLSSVTWLMSVKARRATRRRSLPYPFVRRGVLVCGFQWHPSLHLV
jgi:hypothetical protein